MAGFLPCPPILSNSADDINLLVLLMNRMRRIASPKLSCRSLAGQRGAAAIEYSLVAALIALVVIFAIGQVGVAVSNLYSVILEAF